MNEISQAQAPLALPKKKAAIVRDALAQMARQQLIEPSLAEQLRAKIAPLPFDWRRLARYSFIVAITCIVISISAALADEWLMALLTKIFSAPWAVKSLVCAVLSAVILVLGLKQRRLKPDNSYSNEAIFLRACWASPAPSPVWAKPSTPGAAISHCSSCSPPSFTVRSGWRWNRNSSGSSACFRWAAGSAPKPATCPAGVPIISAWRIRCASCCSVLR